MNLLDTFQGKNVKAFGKTVVPLPVVYRPQTFSSGKVENGATQNHVNTMISAACLELSRPSIGQEIVLLRKKESTFGIVG